MFHVLMLLFWSKLPVLTQLLLAGLFCRDALRVQGCTMPANFSECAEHLALHVFTAWLTTYGMT